jgi:hypothetical protein
MKWTHSPFVTNKMQYYLAINFFMIWQSCCWATKVISPAYLGVLGWSATRSHSHSLCWEGRTEAMVPESESSSTPMGSVTEHSVKWSWWMSLCGVPSTAGWAPVSPGVFGGQSTVLWLWWGGRLAGRGRWASSWKVLYVILCLHFQFSIEVIESETFSEKDQIEKIWGFAGAIHLCHIFFLKNFNDPVNM